MSRAGVRHADRKIAQRVLFAARCAGLSQYELGGIIGRAQSTISDTLHQGRKLTAGELSAIAWALCEKLPDVDHGHLVDWLLWHTNDRPEGMRLPVRIETAQERATRNALARSLGLA